jgi:16S rRNA (cytidine1402-2'-O)-methyltransferase
MSAGTLYIIASPLGNPEDITIRALNILKECDAVFCEDTRVTGRLLSQHGIKVRLISMHSHSTAEKIERAASSIAEGMTAAYMSDCGTPGISDPGGRLVAAARDAGADVIPVPGPSALTAVLSVCGFPAKRVIFAGFLSKKEGRRKNELTALRSPGAVIVLYESPHRIKKLLAAVAEIFPEASIFIAREMTKTYEEFLTAKGAELPALLETLTDKGEFTIAIYEDD